MFITKEDLKTLSVPEVVNRLINSDDSIVENVIAESIDIMKGYFQSAGYDTQAIFTAEADNRSLSVLKHLKRIVKYELYARKDHPRDQDTQNDYDETMTTLQNVAIGKDFIANLPKKTTEDTAEDSPLILGSQNLYSSDW